MDPNSLMGSHSPKLQQEFQKKFMPMNWQQIICALQGQLIGLQE
jgi:hypothetical protein